MPVSVARSCPPPDAPETSNESDTTGAAAATPSTAPYAAPNPQSGRSGKLLTSSAQVAAGLVGRLVGLRLRPGRRVGGGKRAERGREREEQRGARVAQRSPRELAGAQRGHQAAACPEQSLRQLGEQRHDAQCQDRAGEQPDCGCSDQERIEAHAAAHGRRQRCAVLAQLPEADHGQDDEGNVDAESLGERSVALPPDRLALGREATPRGERRHHQPDQAGQPRDAGHDERGGVDPGLDVHAGVRQRTDRVEHLQRGEGDPGRGQRGGDHEHEPFEERHPGHVPGGCPTRAEHGGLDAALIDEQSGHQHERVGRQDHELDRQQQHAGAAHQQRSIGVLEDLWQAGRHAEERGVPEIGADPALERGGVAAQPANVLQRQVVEVGERAPAHVQLAGRHAIDQVVAGDDQRAVDGERRPFARCR